MTTMLAVLHRPHARFGPLFAVADGDGASHQPAFMYAPLPENTAWDATIDQAAVAVELDARAQRSRWINYNDYTTNRLTVPNTQPLEPVLLWRSNWGSGYTGANRPPWALSIDKVCRAGFPIPPDYTPDRGTDKELVLLQPNYQHPAWTKLAPPLKGRMWEGWVFEPNPAYDPGQAKAWPNFPWRCGWAGRVAGLNTWPGHFLNRTTGYDATNPANPDGTYQSVGMGASASGIALADTELLTADLDRHHAGAWGLGHCIGLSVPTVGGHRWPAQRSDASSPTTYPLKYGMRLALPAGHEIPPNVHPVCRALIQNCIISDNPRRPAYGLVVREQTSSAVVIKAQPGAQTHWAGVSPAAVLAPFPWTQLKVLATGHDSNPVPLEPLEPPS